MSLHAELKTVLDASREDPGVIRRLWDKFQEDVEAGAYDGDLGDFSEMLGFFKGQNVGGGLLAMPNIDQMIDSMQSMLQPSGGAEGFEGLVAPSKMHEFAKVVGEQFDGDVEAASSAMKVIEGMFGPKTGGGGGSKFEMLQMWDLFRKMGIFDIVAPGAPAPGSGIGPHDTSWGQVIKDSQRGKRGLRSDPVVDWEDYIQVSGGAYAPGLTALREQEREVRAQIEKMQNMGPDYSKAGAGGVGSMSDAYDAWHNNLRDLQARHRELKEQYRKVSADMPPITLTNAPGFEGWKENKRNQPDPSGDLQRQILMAILGLGPEGKGKKSSKEGPSSGVPRRRGDPDKKADWEIAWEKAQGARGATGQLPQDPALAVRSGTHPGQVEDVRKLLHDRGSMGDKFSRLKDPWMGR